MTKLLITVDDRLHIEGRGLVVSPDLPSEVAPKKAGDYSVTLKLPNGKTKDTVASVQYEFRRYVTIEALQEALDSGQTGIICTFKNLKPKDVPVGTEVWLVNEAK
jgi:hypothetical protein